ncbi:Predicted nucleotidyltransferase [Caloramator quimbayensis]|uniref:Predicted nucleotidyltransferase n=1 Tax=Caloramator quimbayensis TaxID=1147123 RepID=A0A1T4X4T4_9CLOT|nr:nucleotidyltransferase domain-containing protein [Caloramator quimbayensis]SKA84449.1 Predicted nucleotidyltransferase [Caloramator quimbayensis]
MYLDEKTVSKIVEFLIVHFDPYVIYLFGSAVKGNFRKDSDIDIAFLSDNNISGYDLFIKAQDLADMLKKEVDLIDLKNSSSVFKAQVVGTGEVIYCSDNTRRKYFEMIAFKDYAILNEERAVILESIQKRGKVYDN